MSALETARKAMANRPAAIATNRCIPGPIGCGQPVGEFRDALSAKEYRISGLCQGCQDKFFGTGEEEK